MRRFIASHPLLTAALVGAGAGLLAAVLLLWPGGALEPAAIVRANRIFATASLPVLWWHGHLFGWVWNGSRASEFLIILPLNGAAWATGLTALVRGLRRSAHVRRIAVGSALAGAALAVLVRIAGIPNVGLYDGVRGLITLAQCPGIMLLELNGYTTYMWDGGEIDGFYRPGPGTLLWFSFANALLVAAVARVARFTWRWIRMPIPRRGPVAEG